MAILVAVALSGCLSDQTPPDPRPAGSLDDYRTCDFRYPDNSTVPCENQATTILRENDRAPSGWFCTQVNSSSGRTFYTYWSPGEDAYAIGYDYSEIDPPFTGLVHLEGAGKNVLMRWDSPGTLGFVKLPDTATAGDSVVFGFHRAWLESNTSSLKAGSLHELWSPYESDEWLIYEVEAEGASHFFQSMTQVVISDRTFYSPEALVLDGDDFDLRIQLRRGGTVAFNLSRGLSPDSDCPTAPIAGL